MTIFNRLESNVRGYCRSFPTTFTKAQNANLRDAEGNEFIDFLAGAGTLNYGHNNPKLKAKLIEFLERDGMLHGLDMQTDAKARFLEVFEKRILSPLELDYKVQFTGPTGTNAVEAALKLARKVTGRTNVISFTNGFHGVSLGSVAATGNSHFRDAAGTPLNNVTFMPYYGYMGSNMDTLEYFETILKDSSSGLDLPAAVIVETVQGEGGVNVASTEWLQQLETLCQEHGILLIIDDIQVGCGRTGNFFSFEKAGIVPDIVTLSKSLSAYGLPMSLVLMKSDLDQWEPGEHNGTFRGNNLAFVSAAEAIELYWSDYRFAREVLRKGALIKNRLEEIAENVSDVDLEVRGTGMIWGLACQECPGLPEKISAAAFERGLIIETSGTDSHVLKILPPLTIEDDQLLQGLDIVADSLKAVLNDDSILEELGLVHAD
ncbi:Diaminobutyrate--2-oxoglutarate transaminase [Gimesia alba]|uniref:Diaminobutyrate--2-oxoglutarate transaminase n=1 Tax=Gimesia alba TaxID=2527973 RepID=A0A517RKR4_9PLAN|nr:diaminobutyrate--2-oxoglutarate transaminase [Gimesia alba]QDT44475.1 Diaminobutyrate--2-oxoglutarate transaminase [Gimesia alba]